MESSTKYKIIDAHIHLAKYPEKEINWLTHQKKYIFLAVSDDLMTSLKTIKLSKLYESIIPAIGIHPWNVDKVTHKDLEFFEKLVSKENIKVLGEIGLDTKFVPQTYEKQLEIFEFFLKLAKENDLSVNLHTPGTWEEVLNLLLKYDIKSAYFHWYTGPESILEKIVEQDYFVGINVAFKWQDKHRRILGIIDINHIITESDGPYIYKGHQLSPELIEPSLKEISIMKDENMELLSQKLKQNLSRYLA